jgi:hypothetical protein
VSGEPIVGAERASNRNIKLPQNTMKSEENTVEIRNNWGKLGNMIMVLYMFKLIF